MCVVYNVSNSHLPCRNNLPFFIACFFLNVFNAHTDNCYALKAKASAFSAF